MTQRRETWGRYRREDGSIVTMIRGPRNRTWFEDENEKRVGPEQYNVVPAVCWVAAETEWLPLDAPVSLSKKMQEEIRRSGSNECDAGGIRVRWNR